MIDGLTTYNTENNLILNYSDWDRLNLKTFFAIFGLQHPEIKQADIAKSLGITAATLSRIINGTYGDKKVRPNWIPEFKSLIMQLDIKKFQEQWDTIKRIHDEYERVERQSKLRKVIENVEDFCASYDNNWNRDDSLLYYDDTDTHLFFEILDDCFSEQKIAQMRRYLGYFIKRERIYIHFVCYTIGVFEQCVDFIMENSNTNTMMAKNIIFSAIDVNLAEEKIIEEYHAYRLC